jgi:hypothetical protein
MIAKATSPPNERAAIPQSVIVAVAVKPRMENPRAQTSKESDKFPMASRPNTDDAFNKASASEARNFDSCSAVANAIIDLLAKALLGHERGATLLTGQPDDRNEISESLDRVDYVYRPEGLVLQVTIFGCSPIYEPAGWRRLRKTTTDEGQSRE